VSPEIDWQVRDETGNEVVAQSASQKPTPRWPKISLVVIVLIGIGLGVIYSSIPATPLPPMPAPLPTATPSALDRLPAVIDRESQALADSDLSTLKDLRDPQAADWLNQTENSTWMRPPSGPLYRLLGYGLLSDGTAWADVIQYRYGSYVRLTRFYTQTADDHDWLRTFPDLSFWSGDRVVTQTEHFQLTYYSQDAVFVPSVAQHYEQVYQRLCSVLECDSPASPLSATRAITLEIRPFDSWTDPQRPIAMLMPLSSHIVMESPRVIGLEYPSLAARTPDPNRWHIDSDLYYGLAYALTMRLAAWPAPPQTERPGSLFLYASVNWAVDQQPPPTRLPSRFSARQADLDTLIQQGTVPLTEVWNSSGGSIDEVAWSEAAVVIDFIAEQYGAARINQLLKAIGPAKSMQQVIENGLGTTYNDFEQQWQIWLKQQGVKVGE
jgi:hypothetical protein